MFCIFHPACGTFVVYYYVYHLVIREIGLLSAISLDWVLLQFWSAPLISRLLILEVRVRSPGQLGLGLGSDRVS